jgi:hypothetical protein
MPPLLPGGLLFIWIQGDLKMPKRELYVERREEGDYAIRRPGSDRSSDVRDNEAEAIDRARDIDPKAAIHVERVRNTNRGSRDKWRRP